MEAYTFEKSLSTSSLTINGALIVKDEVDKVFELILFVKKQKFFGLKAYCVRVCPWTYAYTLAAIHAVNSNRIVII